jgi:large subunit ribosomal protein L32e
MNIFRLKKSHPKFNVPNQGAVNRSRVPDRWRKQRGIDNKKRIKKDFMGATPGIGYKNPAAVAGLRASGNRLMVVHNMTELQKLAGKAGIEVAMASSIGSRKRTQMRSFASEKKINIVN